jgi:hypothetical protein
MFPERFVLEALPMSVLSVCYADEAEGIFSGVFGAGGDDSGKCGIPGEWRWVVEGFRPRSSEALDSGVDAPGYGAPGFGMAEAVIGRV